MSMMSPYRLTLPQSPRDNEAPLARCATNRASLSLGAVSNSDVGGHGSPLFPVSCSFDDLDFTDFQQLAEAFHEVQPLSSSASLALNFPSDYDVLKSMLSHDMSQESHLPRSDSVHQFPLCSSSPQYLIICDMVLPRCVAFFCETTFLFGDIVQHSLP